MSSTHQCHLCQKSFTRATTLSDHLRAHAEIRKFSCEDCDATFVRKWDLTTHRKIHTQQPSFKCAACGAAFRRKRDLWRHQKGVHGVQDPKASYETQQNDVQAASTLNMLRDHGRPNPQEDPGSSLQPPAENIARAAAEETGRCVLSLQTGILPFFTQHEALREQILSLHRISTLIRDKLRIQQDELLTHLAAGKPDAQTEPPAIQPGLDVMFLSAFCHLCASVSGNPSVLAILS